MAPTVTIPQPTSNLFPEAAELDRTALGRRWVIIAAAVALVVKMLIAWNTIGTNDVISFYHFGKSLTSVGLEATYAGQVSFNHPPLVAAFLRGIYALDHIPWMHQYGIAFPFLLRLPGIIADFVVVLVLLGLARPLRLPIWSLFVLAVSPVSLMVSGFHGNTDSLMVLFVVLAAYMCERERPISCAFFLALSCQVKIVPLLLVPIFFFHWLFRNRSLSFTLTLLSASVLFWIDPLLHFPAIFVQRVLLYGSFWGIWGITYWLKLTGIQDFGPVTYYNFLPMQQVVVTGLKVVIVLAVLSLAWRRRKLDAHGVFASLGWAWVIFFILSPGVCAQYMVWLMPFVLVLSPRFFAWLTLTSSLFLFFFYNSIAHGLPWYLAISDGSVTVEWVPWTVWPWATLIVGAVLLWRRACKTDPELRLWSLAPVKRLLKNWSGLRVEAEGADGKERARRIPARGCNERATPPGRPFCLAPQGLRCFRPWPALLAWSRWQGYRPCARALARAQNNSNATHSSISTVS
ncbi:hypothetical protein BH20VER3_BH20VER3_05480 [soil metagenome]